MNCQIEDNCNNYFCWIDGDKFPKDIRDGIDRDRISDQQWFRLCDKQNKAEDDFFNARLVKPSSICDKWELGKEP
jgi:hypothetical protein